METVSDVRRFAARLPDSTEALVGGRVKFRVGRNRVPKRVAAAYDVE
jgi:hypothetical protein